MIDLVTAAGLVVVRVELDSADALLGELRLDRRVPVFPVDRAAEVLYVIAVVRRLGLDVIDAEDVVERDWSQPHEPRTEITAVFRDIYEDPERYWDEYEMCEKLVDVDDAFLAWRHKHVLTVARIIGKKMGTGGTAGVAYLESTLSKRCFPELWTLRTLL